MIEQMNKDQDQIENAIDTPNQLAKDVQSPLSVIQATPSFDKVNLLDSSEYEKAKVLMTTLTRSNKCGINSIEEGMALLVKAKDLGIPFTAAVEHVHLVNGKTGIDVHIIKALLSRAGVVWKKVDDYTPLYEYTDGFNVYVDGKLPTYAIKVLHKKEAEEKASANNDEYSIYVYPIKCYKDFNGNVYKEYNLNNNYKIVTNKIEAQSAKDSGKIPIFRIPSIPCDYIVSYEFIRYINGSAMTATSSFSYTEAQAAELFDKDTYKKYAKTLIGHRAFTLGARDIASDVLMGCMETTELYTSQNVPMSEVEIIDISDN